MTVSWTPEQTAALEDLVAWSESPLVTMKSFTGVAGAGKTTVLGELKRKLAGMAEWTAMTGKAALRLSEAAGVSASTLHKALYKPPFNSTNKPHFSEVRKPSCSTLVIDESSMVSPKIFEDLNIWQDKGVKILFVGDGVQLPPILTPKEEKSYGDDFCVFKQVSGPNLTKVMRSGNGIVDVTTELRTGKRFPTKGNDSVKISQTRYPGIASISDYLEDRDDHFMITWTNKMRMQGNLEVRRKLKLTRPLPEAGEPVVICKNGQGLLNGEIITVESFSTGPEVGGMATHWMTQKGGGDPILVSCGGRDQFFDGSLPDLKDWKGYHFDRKQQGLDEPLPVTYGYVHTCHRMQGSEARRITVYLSGNDIESRYFNKPTTLHTGEVMPFSVRWIYTAFSRSKEQLTFYHS